MMSNNFDNSLVTRGTGVRRQDTFVARVVEEGAGEAQQRLPNAEACGTHRSGGTEADKGPQVSVSRIRGRSGKQ